MKNLEHLAIAICKTTGGFTAESTAFQLHNPGLLKAFAPKHQDDSYRGYRRFSSWQAGFKALVFDLSVKCSGKSHASVKEWSTIKDLLGLWEIKEPRKIINFLRRACGDESINENTSLEYFV
jgi:hypothetical protein